ncbi:MAG TPA: AbrB/MazE/SpoVT family DNA-binding domain-containing protein [Armatimonadota bacterium]|jgi:antitoxin component of MazEF toxin-antitoxin module
MMIKKLTRHGNSRALVIDRAVLELLHIDENTPLEISTDGTRLIIEPVPEGDRRACIEASLATGNARYGRMLKKLAG